jgi:site-specific DNA-methyltransferase (adenine-specific)
MGDAKLWQADCLRVFEAGLIPAHSVDLILADLPYGTTACAWDSRLPLEPLWQAYKRVLTSTGAVLLTAADGFDTTLHQSNPAWFRYKWVWEKSRGANGVSAARRPITVHEYVLVFYQHQPTYNPQMTYGHKPVAAFRNEAKGVGAVFNGPKGGGRQLVSTHKGNNGARYPRSVLHDAQDEDADTRADLSLGYYRVERGKHDTQKPVRLMRDLILTYSNAGDVILDNTMGSGTTGVACVQTGRRFLGIELHPGSFQAACTRIGEATKEREEETRQGQLFAG